MTYTFLNKLDYLMDIKGLNKNSLSKASQIPYTTIDGWYKKGYEGLKLTTLTKLSEYFNVGLDYWADDEVLDPTKKSPVSEIPETRDDMIASLFYDFLVEAGYTREGDELPERQLRGIAAVLDFVEVLFYDQINIIDKTG